MFELFVYAVIFLASFAVAGGAAALAWVALDPGRGGKGAQGTNADSSLLRREVLSTLSLLSLLIEKARFAPRLKQLLHEANLDWSVGRTTLAILVSATFTLALLVRFEWIPFWAALGCAAAAGYLPIGYIRSRRNKRLREVEEQLPEALEYVSRALVAGHSLPMSLELLADEVGPPLSVELRKAVDEYNLGLPMSNALQNLSRRLPTVDIQFFVSAVLTQARSGGSLHEVLENLADTIRDRATLKQRVRALSAHGRLTAVILCLLPLFVTAVLYSINREYLFILTGHPIGKTLVFLAACSQVAAYFVIRKIVDIKV